MTELDAICLGGWLLIPILGGLWLWAKSKSPY